MYKKDDYVIYKHDICKIKDIKENKITGKTYYVMTPIDDDSLIIDTPIENKIGFLRDIISKENAEILINKISQPIDNTNNKNIESQYRELLNTGTHENLIKIIKTTYLRNENRINNKKKSVKKIVLISNLQKNFYIAS